MVMGVKEIKCDTNVIAEEAIAFMHLDNEEIDFSGEAYFQKVECG